MGVEKIIRRRLIWMFLAMLVVVVGVMWPLQTFLINRKAASVRDGIRESLRQAVVAASDRKMLDIARVVADRLPPLWSITEESLKALADEVGADEIHVFDKRGVIVRTTYPKFMGFDLRSGDQSRPFVCLLEGAKEYAQDFGPIAYDARIFRKYVGVALARGGFVQLGFDADRYLAVPDLSLGRTLPIAEALAVMLLVFATLLSTVKIFRNYYVAEATRRLGKDLSAAKLIQTAALPSVFPPYPNLAGHIDIHAAMLPAMEVGGDFYDFFFVAPGRLALVVADVRGKGMTAALFMIRVKLTLQALLRDGLSLDEALAETGKRLEGGADSAFGFGIWAGIVDLRTGVVTALNRGQHPPMPLGTDTKMDGATFTLKPGEGFFLRSAGAVAAVNADGDRYGEKRLSAVVGRGGCAKEVVQNVADDIRAFIGATQQEDDVALLVFRLNRCI